MMQTASNMILVVQDANSKPTVFNPAPYRPDILAALSYPDKYSKSTLLFGNATRPTLPFPREFPTHFHFSARRAFIRRR
jgi:hypothetical protein